MSFSFSHTIIFQLLTRLQRLEAVMYQIRKVFSQSVTKTEVRHETNQVFYHISSLGIDADGVYAERFGVAETVLIRIR
jgi:hypothetical protein